jgi:hypothetical protein
LIGWTFLTFNALLVWLVLRADVYTSHELAPNDNDEKHIFVCVESSLRDAQDEIIPLNGFSPNTSKVNLKVHWPIDPQAPLPNWSSTVGHLRHALNSTYDNSGYSTKPSFIVEENDAVVREVEIDPMMEF